jgi:protein tyrosine/serine phosphatase
MSIPNLKLIEAGKIGNIWRGGQPESPDDIDNLKSLGVRQIIKLNSESAEDEQDHCNTTGIAFFYCLITLTEQILTEPDLQSIRDAVGFIAPGTLVHCEHGIDRTGVCIAMWRVSQGWSCEQAENEMMEMGFHKILFGLWKVWEDFKNERS